MLPSFFRFSDFFVFIFGYMGSYFYSVFYEKSPENRYITAASCNYSGLSGDVPIYSVLLSNQNEQISL